MECKDNRPVGYWIRQYRINRNIMECKEKLKKPPLTARLCINRNIMECKGRHRCSSRRTQKVLIETLWNVKEDRNRSDTGSNAY